MRRIVALALSLMIVTAACGDDAGGEMSEGERALADAITQAILEEDDPSNPLGPAEAECIAEQSVRSIGVEGLAKVGITRENPNPEDAFEVLTDAEAGAIIDVFLDCVDVADVFIQGMAQDGNLSAESEGCIREALQEGDILRIIMEAGMRGDDIEDVDPETFARLLQITFGCLSPEELVDLAG